jgi:hypothetical protein
MVVQISAQECQYSAGRWRIKTQNCQKSFRSAESLKLKEHQWAMMGGSAFRAVPALS